MRSISQRELRNDSGEIMRQVAGGTSFEVTSRGRPIAVVTPWEGRASEDLIQRRGHQRLDLLAEPLDVSEDTGAVLAELRGER